MEVDRYGNVKWRYKSSQSRKTFVDQKWRYKFSQPRKTFVDQKWRYKSRYRDVNIYKIERKVKCNPCKTQVVGKLLKNLRNMLYMRASMGLYPQSIRCE